MQNYDHVVSNSDTSCENYAGRLKFFGCVTVMMCFYGAKVRSLCAMDLRTDEKIDIFVKII